MDGCSLANAFAPPSHLMYFQPPAPAPDPAQMMGSQQSTSEMNWVDIKFVLNHFSSKITIQMINDFLLGLFVLAAVAYTRRNG